MSSLYEKFTHGDLRTVVKKFPKGKRIDLNGSTIVLKAPVAMKVTEEYDAVIRNWREAKYDLDSMVEITKEEVWKESRPEPTSIPKSCDHVAAMATDGPCPICFPKAETITSRGFWQWFTSFFKKQEFPYGEGE